MSCGPVRRHDCIASGKYVSRYSALTCVSVLWFARQLQRHQASTRRLLGLLHGIDLAPRSIAQVALSMLVALQEAQQNHAKSI